MNDLKDNKEKFSLDCILEILSHKFLQYTRGVTSSQAKSGGAVPPFQKSGGEGLLPPLPPPPYSAAHDPFLNALVTAATQLAN